MCPADDVTSTSADDYSLTYTQTWQRVSKYALHPNTPFAVHKLVAAAVFHDWDEQTHGPHPLWYPVPSAASRTNLATFMRTHPDLLSAADSSAPHGCLVADFERLHRTSVNSPERFWPPVLVELGVEWDVAPHRVLLLENRSDPDSCLWFPGARMNIAKVALWGRDPDATAIIYAPEDAPRWYVTRLTVLAVK